MAQPRTVLILSLLALASPLRASRPAPDAVLEPGRGLLQANVATPEVVNAGIAHSASIGSESTIGPVAWPVPDGYR